MPKNKPHKKVSLTKTKKKTGELKRKIINEIRENISSHKYIYIFSVINFKNSFLREAKLKWTKENNNRFFFSKNRVMALALGRTSEEEVAENLHLVSNKLIGNRGLFFTDAPKEEVLSYFDSYKCLNHAKAGDIAQETIEIPEGNLEQFSHSLEPYLRKLGLPVLLKQGVPFVYAPYTICKRGDLLNPEQAKLLKLFDEKLSEFQIVMEFLWSQEGYFEDLGRTKDIIFARKKSKKLKPKQNKKVNDGDSSNRHSKETEMDEDDNGLSDTINEDSLPVSEQKEMDET